MQASGPTSGSHLRIKMGVTKEGRITAAHAYFAFEAGAFPGAPLQGAAAAVFAPYNIQNVQIDGYDVVDNKPKTTAYRAPGAPIVAYAIESVVDEIAERLGMDSMELRLLNVAEQGTRRADGMVNARIGARETMEAVRSHPHFSTPLEGKHRGRGVAMGFCRNNSGMASAVANVLPDGRVSLIEGQPDIGGTRTSLAQQLAEVLGIPVEDVVPEVADTDTIGYTSNTAGSGATFKSGWAVYEAANDVKRQLVQRAATLWGVPEAEIEYVEGELRHVADTELCITFREMAAELPATGGPVVGRANLNPGGSGGSYSANIVDVEVDAETGKVEILRYTAFQDAGTAIHPGYVEGQIQGGTSQGIGWALNEEYFMSEDGHLLNSTLLDYRMPTSLDLPMIEAVVVEVPNPGHPFGVRGVGEANIVPPLAAMANAVYYATGVRMNSLPMNPQAVRKALEAKGLVGE
jgi:CO/xanthine dehydrogenase Mo-binding subunit